jgi:hypothetical protein
MSGGSICLHCRNLEAARRIFGPGFWGLGHGSPPAGRRSHKSPLANRLKSSRLPPTSSRTASPTRCSSPPLPPLVQPWSPGAPPSRSRLPRSRSASTVSAAVSLCRPVRGQARRASEHVVIGRNKPQLPLIAQATEGLGAWCTGGSCQGQSTRHVRRSERNGGRACEQLPRIREEHIYAAALCR